MLETRLAPLDQAFANAKPMLVRGELPPDGVYQGVIDDFDFIEANKTGELFLKTIVKLAGDEYGGQTIDKLNALEDPERFDMLKTHLDRMGVDTAQLKLSEIEQVLVRLTDVPVQLTIKTSDKVNPKNGQPYRDWYVDKRLGSPLRQQADVPADTDGLPGLEPQPVAAAAADETIPF